MAADGRDTRGAGGSGPGADSLGPVLLFDGVCGLCNWTVRVVLGLDRRGKVRFAPLDGEYATGVSERHPEVRDVDSLVLVEPSTEAEVREGEGAGEAAAGHEARDATASRGARPVERVYVKSAAVLRLAHHLGGAWRVVELFGLVPRPLRDWAYDVVARHRYAVFGRFEERPMPPVDTRSRFLA